MSAVFNGANVIRYQNARGVASEPLGFCSRPIAFGCMVKAASFAGPGGMIGFQASDDENATLELIATSGKAQLIDRASAGDLVVFDGPSPTVNVWQWAWHSTTTRSHRTIGVGAVTMTSTDAITANPARVNEILLGSRDKNAHGGLIHFFVGKIAHPFVVYNNGDAEADILAMIQNGDSPLSIKGCVFYAPLESDAASVFNGGLAASFPAGAVTFDPDDQPPLNAWPPVAGGGGSAQAAQIVGGRVSA
jgi:hypothetical protein